MFNVRSNLTLVHSQLKQQSYITAVQSTYNAVKALASKSGLTKLEIKELQSLIAEACAFLQNDQTLQGIYAFDTPYTPGQEQEFLEFLGAGITALEDDANQRLAKNATDTIAQKKLALAKGKNELEMGDHVSARETFSDLTKEFHDDANLASKVGEHLLKHGLYEDASTYLEQSSAMDGGSARVLNNLGIALRKMKRFDAAEQKFIQAIRFEQNDPNLHFNLGRLYLDCEEWEKSITAAQKALHLDSGFTQARQMMVYAQRMAEKKQ